MLIDKEKILYNLGVAQCYYRLSLHDSHMTGFHDNQLLYFLYRLYNCIRHYNELKYMIAPYGERDDKIFNRFLNLSLYDIIYVCVENSIVDNDNIFTFLLNTYTRRRDYAYIYRRIVKMIHRLDNRKSKNITLYNLAKLYETDEEFIHILYNIQHNKNLTINEQSYVTTNIWKKLARYDGKIPVKIYTDNVHLVKRRTS